MSANAASKPVAALVRLKDDSAGTEGSFCYRKDVLEHLSVNEAAFVVIEGVKLTGWIDFDCGSFRSGQLFEDSVVAGRPRQQGERVSREDLSPQNGG